MEYIPAYMYLKLEENNRDSMRTEFMHEYIFKKK